MTEAGTGTGAVNGTGADDGTEAAGGTGAVARTGAVAGTGTLSPPQSGPGPIDPIDPVEPIDPVGPSSDGEALAPLEARDWPWVEEWRAGGERTPWAPGVTVAAFFALLIGAAVFVLCSGLADRPVVDVAVNVIVAGGLAPAVWLSRGLPVLRWFALGAVVGAAAAWLGALVFLL